MSETVDSLAALLDACGLSSSLASSLAGETSDGLKACLADSGRVALLKRLGERGLSLPERQKLAMSDRQNLAMSDRRESSQGPYCPYYHTSPRIWHDSYHRSSGGLWHRDFSRKICATATPGMTSKNVSRISHAPWKQAARPSYITTPTSS